MSCEHRWECAERSEFKLNLLTFLLFSPCHPLEDTSCSVLASILH